MQGSLIVLLQQDGRRIVGHFHGLVVQALQRLVRSQQLAFKTVRFDYLKIPNVSSSSIVIQI